MQLDVLKKVCNLVCICCRKCVNLCECVVGSV